MTVGMAWISRRNDGREHLYIASDSRVRGGHVMDACPKILTLPRSDCAICFAGMTDAAYPLMLQVANAIAAHLPSRSRAMDVCRLKAHVLRICTDLIHRFREQAAPFDDREVQFLLAGYSWLTNDFKIWTIEYRSSRDAFREREAVGFHARLRKAAFIGDRASRLRSMVMQDLERSTADHWELEPLGALSKMLEDPAADDTVGGPPQVIRISKHMNTRCFAVHWKGQDTLFGRPLFEYENVDYWWLDPVRQVIRTPRPIRARRRVDIVGEPPPA